MTTTDAKPLEASRARLAELQEEASDRLARLKREATQRADITVGTIRDTGAGLAFSTSALALDGAATVARTLPVVGRELSERLEKRASTFTERESALQQPSIDDYDELNVKQVAEALEGLGAWELQKVRRYEEAHKDRKTVYGAIDRLLR